MSAAHCAAVLAEFTGDYPWSWQPTDAEEFSTSLRGLGRPGSMIGASQQALKLFCEFATDPRGC